LFVQWHPNGDRIVVWPKEGATGKMIAPPWMSN
jgi:branched-chain amino acid transport system substrate-binding protein